MQFNVEDLSSVKKVLHIEISEDVVTKAVEDAYKELKKTAKIKGFRPGKAPRQVLERKFRKDVDQDVTGQLIQDSFAEALQESQLNIVGSPQVDPPAIEYKKPYKYDATVEIRPELDDLDIVGLKLKKTKYQINDGEVDGQLKMLQRNLVYNVPIEEERGAQEGDFVLITYEGFKDGQPFEETQKTENYTLKIGEGQIEKALDDGITGMKAGESKEITVSFPDDYKNDKLSGLDILFKVELIQIQKEEIPEINDEFAKNFGPYENLEGLKQDIATNLEQGYEKRTHQELNEQIFTALLERQDFEVPEAMVNAELDAIVNEAQRSFEYHNMTMEQVGKTEASLRAQYQDLAVKQVKRLVILGKVIDQEKLELTDEELDEGFEEMARSFGQPAEEVKKYYNLPEAANNLEYFKHSLLEKKAIRLIIDKSDIEEVAPDDAGEETEEEA